MKTIINGKSCTDAAKDIGLSLSNIQRYKKMKDLNLKENHHEKQVNRQIKFI